MEDVLNVRETRRKELPKPLFTRDTFKIEPLRGVRSSRLLSIASEGEAILSPDAAEDLDVGDEVILNSAAERIPHGWIVMRIHDRVEE